MGLEGELRVGLHLHDGRIDRVRIASTRPDVARAVLRGRTRAEIQSLVPRLFSICAVSQAAASDLACAAAAGEAPGADTLAQCSADVSAEAIRECAWRTLLDWPRSIGEQPAAGAVAAARSAATHRADATAAPDVGPESIAAAVFGVSAENWLALRTLSDLDRWIDAGTTAAARFIRRVRDDDATAVDSDARDVHPTALLDAAHDAAAIVGLHEAIDADPEFARHPLWRDAPAETGALARQRADPLVAKLDRRSTTRVPARFVARLRELALLLAGRKSARVGTRTTSAGHGIAWVENARGLLIHRVQLDGDRAPSYAIVAPTDWNFHPDGALASALLGGHVRDADVAQRLATRLVDSLDPCVTCRVELDDA
jgi:hypothetical protein